MTRSQQNKSRINTRQNKQGRYTQVVDATNFYSMRMMTEIMSKFQDSQREMMQTMLNTTNKNAEDMLSSLKSVETSMKTFTSHIRDTQTLLTEMKTATRPILSHENDPENTAVTAVVARAGGMQQTR